MNVVTGRWKENRACFWCAYHRLKGNRTGGSSGRIAGVRDIFRAEGLLSADFRDEKGFGNRLSCMRRDRRFFIFKELEE